MKHMRKKAVHCKKSLGPHIDYAFIYAGHAEAKGGVSYLLVANGGVTLALTVNPHKGIGQTLDSDGNLDKVVKGNIAATFRFFT